jgi:hypothetical protein
LQSLGRKVTFQLQTTLSTMNCRDDGDGARWNMLK